MRLAMSHKFRVALLLSLFVISRAPAQTATLLPYEYHDWSGVRIAAKEVGGAVVAGSVLGLGLGYAATLAADGQRGLFEPPVLPGYGEIGCMTLGCSAGAALGTWLVGSVTRQDHFAYGAFLGALVALPASVGLVVAAGAMEKNGKPGTLLLIPAFAAPAAGAVIGYNLTPSCGCHGSTSQFGSRLLPPSIGLRDEPGEATVVAYDVRLLNVGF
jgi:hypothetical protein